MIAVTLSADTADRILQFRSPARRKSQRLAFRILFVSVRIWRYDGGQPAGLVNFIYIVTVISDGVYNATP